MSHGYRADIDGLRAVAVVLVVLFHAGLTGLGGGFVGVDVFFVISGYLISGILFDELKATGRISLLGFYARRVARIVPTLVLVTCATLAAGVLLLSSTLFEVHSLAKSAAATLLFAANFYFLSATTGYFAEDAGEQPLLHTWSLGIEEQFYLAWPVLLIAAARLGRGGGGAFRTRCLIAVGLITIASLAHCAWLNPTRPALAFFLPTTRFWELGIGSMLALGEGRLARAGLGSAAAVVGLAAVVLSALLAREDTGFPLPWAVAPVLGTALIIVANAQAPSGPVARLLAARPLVSLGKVSYAWYLWHWPPLAFAQILTLGAPPPLWRAAAVAASLMAAYLTVAVYELPLRRRLRAMPPLRAVLGGAAALGLAFGLSGSAWLAARAGVLPDDPRIAAAFTDRNPGTQLCLLPTAAAIPPPAGCLAPDGAPRVVLWGDSHADQWAPALQRWTENRAGWRLERLTRQACPPLVGLSPMHAAKGLQGADPTCRPFNDFAVSRLGGGAPTVVVLAANWAPRAGLGAFPANRPSDRYFDSAAGSVRDSVQALEGGLRATFEALAEHRVPAVIVLQSPYWEWQPAKCLARRPEADCAVAETAFRERVAIVNDAIVRVAASFPQARVVNPADFLCERGRCSGRVAGRVGYYDEAHVAASVASGPAAMRVWRPALDGAAAAAR